MLPCHNVNLCLVCCGLASARACVNEAAPARMPLTQGRARRAQAAPRSGAR
jgi:hypothetical protein